MESFARLRDVSAQTNEQLYKDAAGLALLVDALLDATGPGHAEAAQRLREFVRYGYLLRHIFKNKRFPIAEMLDSPLVDVRYIGICLLDSHEPRECIPKLLRGLGDKDEEFRRSCIARLRHSVAPEALLPHLRSAQAEEREAALDVLHHSRLEQLEAVLSVLRELLADPVPSIRHLAASVLHEDMEAPGLYKVLLDTVQASPDVELRLRAIQALERHELGEDAIPVMLDALRRDEKVHEQAATRRQEDYPVHIQRIAASALRRFAPMHAHVVDALIAALRDPSREVGGEAARALHERGPATESANPRLLAALEDETIPEAARGSIAYVLAQLNQREVIPILLRLLARPGDSFNDHYDWSIRRGSCHGSHYPPEPQLKLAAARALSMMTPLPTEAVPAFLSCIQGDNQLSVVAAQAVLHTGLAHAEVEKLLRQLLPTLSDSSRYFLREKVLALLANFKERNAELRETVKGWISQEGEIHPDARSQLWVLVRNQPDFMERIETLASDSEHAVAYAAKEALRVLGKPHTDVVMRLVSRLSSTDAGARERAIVDLRLYPHRGTWLADPLGVRLRGASPEARIAILKVLGVANSGSPGSKPFGIFEPVLNDANPRVREAAAWALCDLIRVYDAMPHVVPRLGDTDARVREAAAWALSLHPQGRETEAPLRAALSDEEPAVRKAAAAALDALEVAHPRQTPGVGVGTLEEVQRSVRAFSLSFYKALGSESLGSYGFSPLSVFTLLAMVLRGARGPTEAELQQVLTWSAAPWRLPGLLQLLVGQLRDLDSREPDLHEQQNRTGFVYRASLGCWWPKDAELRAEYIAELTERFGVTPERVELTRDWRDEGKVIDSWVRERTDDARAHLRIGAKQMAARYVMASTVHMHLRWERPVFRETKDARFHLLNGGEVDVPMMTLGGRFGYARGDWYQLIELPLAGGHTSMVVLLPDAGFLTRAERLLHGAKVEALLGGMNQENFVLTLPRFSLMTSTNLSWKADFLGLASLFKPGADLSGMTSAGEPFQGSVNHIASVTVDEPAAEKDDALAPRAEEVPRAGAGRRPLRLLGPNMDGIPDVVEANRPFFFIVRHEATGALLFLGRMVDPRPPAHAR